MSDEGENPFDFASGRRLWDYNPSNGDMLPKLAFFMILIGIGLHVLCNLIFMVLFLVGVNRTDIAYGYWK